MSIDKPSGLLVMKTDEYIQEKLCINRGEKYAHVFCYPAFWKLFPEVKIAIITVHNINNQDRTQVPDSVLQHANEIAPTLIPDEPISNNGIV